MDNIKNRIESENLCQRREFLTSMISVVGAATLLVLPGFTMASSFTPTDSLTVQQIIDLILKEIPGANFKDTVDTLKAGDPAQPVTGIVTTMFATTHVIKKTAELGANFIIAHEPTFYNHTDDTTWLATDKVYLKKRDLLEQHKIAVWRFHDYMHAHKPDGVRMGVLEKLGWQKYYEPENPQMITIPPTTLNDIINQAKKGLGISTVRVIGDRKQICKRIAIMPGASGGRSHIQLLQKERPDVLLCGEIHEWETSEYIRDARAQGMAVSLVVLGHSVSEEPGLEWLVPWLQPKVSGIKVTHVASNSPFTEQ